MAGDICNLLLDNSQAKVNYTLQSTSLKKVLGAVVELGTYYYSLASYNEIAESILRRVHQNEIKNSMIM